MAAFIQADETWVDEGDGFAFIAAEQSVVAPGRALLTARGVDLERAVVKGYWKRSPSTATSGQGLVIR